VTLWAAARAVSSKTYYGTILYGIALGKIKLVHCIKGDSATVWKDQAGVEITGEYKDFDTDSGTCRIYKGFVDADAGCRLQFRKRTSVSRPSLHALA
jgi:hypothetical protein